MITGPFWPLAPWWMWAAVAFRLLTSTRPVTTLSPMTAIELRPEAWVFTGGTSCAPVSVSMPLSAAVPIRLSIFSILAHPPTARTAVSTVPAIHITLCR